MIRYFLTILGLVLFSQTMQAQEKITDTKEKQQVANTLNRWHNMASEANFKGYFNLMTEDAIFIGTDATENWTRPKFEAFCKPYFEKKRTWHFKAIQRNIYFNENYSIAWFDELLDTQMKICRGSGILKKINDEWKITHYVLSISIPNENTKPVVELKTKFDDSLKSVLLK